MGFQAVTCIFIFQQLHWIWHLCRTHRPGVYLHRLSHRVTQRRTWKKKMVAKAMLSPLDRPTEHVTYHGNSGPLHELEQSARPGGRGGRIWDGWHTTTTLTTPPVRTTAGMDAEQNAKPLVHATGGRGTCACFPGWPADHHLAPFFFFCFNWTSPDSAATNTSSAFGPNSSQDSPRVRQAHYRQL